MVVVYAVVHAGSTLGLYAVNLNAGVERLDGIGHTAYQSTAADGHHYGLYIGQLVQQFQTYSALSGYHVLVIERVNKGVAVLVAQLQGPAVGIVIHAWHQAYFGS